MRRLFVVITIITLLSACGLDRGMPNPTFEDNTTTQSGTQNGDASSSKGVLNYVERTFPLIDVVKSSANQQDVTRIFKAENKSIDEVAKNLLDNVKEKPIEVSENTGEKQVIVYDQFFATLTKDPEYEANTFVEVATYGFVRDNYQPNFFNGLLVWWVLDEILDVDDWGKKQKQRCLNSPGGCYSTYYGSGKGFKGPVGQPSLRGGSSNVRGGGPGTGK